MGSITHVMDEEGNLLNHYEYDAWGNLTLEDEQVFNRFKYTGEQFDDITQQYYLRARFYNPALARFMQEDTYRGDGLNLYAYCTNNPVRYVDPSGHWCEVKQNAYERLVKENGFDINNIDPDTKLRFMAEAANIVKGLDVWRNDTIIELPEIVSPEQNRPSGLVADMPNDGRHGEGGSKSGTSSGYYQDANGRWHRPNGDFASNAEVGIASPAKTATGSHGNSLSDPRTNYGYVLVDKDTNEILKFGETLYPETRYSKSSLEQNNAVMKVLESGSKEYIHHWQYDMNKYFEYMYDEFPSLLKSKGW